MAFCPHCHALLPEDAVSCQNCGQTIQTADYPTQAVRRVSGPLPLGDYLRAGWHLFKQYPGGFVGFFLLFLVVNTVLNAVPLVGRVAAFAISSPLVIGNFIVGAKLLQRQPVEFKDFFAGFNFFLPLLLVSVLSAVLISIGMILLIIPGVYLAVGFAFALNLVVDRRLDFWPAMDLSRRTVHPLWFGVFIFGLLLLLVNLVGVICLGVGILVSAPLSFCAMTAAYADIFGLQSDYSGKDFRLKQD